MTCDVMFALRGVSVTYPDGRAVLAGVDLAVGEGDFVLVRGPSGAGKSTFLRLLNGIVAPTAGEILSGGDPWPATTLPASAAG